MLVHGILSSADTWGDGPGEWTEGAAGTRLYRADYSATSTEGYSENYRIVPATIHKAIEDYRLGRDQDPADTINIHEPFRGFRGVRYAATRADVVCHSMGGQLARFYMSSLNSYPTVTHRGGPDSPWTPMVYFRDPSSTTFNVPFLRDENYGAGDIRRFVPIGSPFNGSPIANTVEPWLRPTTLNETAIQALRPIMSQALQDYIFYPGTDHYHQPTCVHDLQEGSTAQSLLEGIPSLYPTDDRAVPWHPVVGIASLEVGAAPVQGLLWELLFFFAPLVPSRPGEVSPLSPANSDLIVEQWSQRNAATPSDHPNAGYGTPFDLHAHVDIPVAGTLGETTSAVMRQTVSYLLSRPRTDFYMDGLYR